MISRIAAILSGEDVSPLEVGDWPALLATAADQGVVALLYDRAVALKWDPALVRALRHRTAAAVALALAQNRELERVLASLADAGVEVLVVKGAHLGLSHYSSPGLRPRTDTDLVIRESRRATLRTCLERLGYAPLPHVTGDVAFSQCQFWRTDEVGVTHALDIHWRVANPRAFADRLPWTELYRDRVALVAGGRHAFGPCAPHALVLGCIHRTAHHGNSNRLIWLFDLRLLSSSLSPVEWETVVQVSQRIGLSSVVADGLRAAGAHAGATVPDDVLRRLDEASPAIEPDLRRFLEGRQSPMGILLSDSRRLSGWSERATFFREHVFPSPAYMASKYQVRARAVLPLLYAHRLVTGGWRWLLH